MRTRAIPVPIPCRRTHLSKVSRLTAQPSEATAMCLSSIVMQISCMNWPTPTHRAMGPGRLAAGQCFTWIQTMCAHRAAGLDQRRRSWLPIFPGLVRYEEAASGVIRHALRFTVNTTRGAYVPPATHWASSNTSPNLPPMGMRVRLKSNFIIPTDSAPNPRRFSRR